MAAFAAWGLHGSLGALARTSSKRAWNSRAPHAAILAEIVATQRSRAFCISPWSALRPPPDCNASGWPGGAGTRSGRDLAISGDISRQRDCVEIAHLPCGPIEVQPASGARTTRHEDIRIGRDCPHSLRWSSTVVCDAWRSGGYF